MPHQLSPSPSSKKIKMLVLETDEPHPDTAATHGSFGDVFDQLFQEAGASHDPPLGIETSMHFVVEPKGGSIPDISAFDNIHAVLITGSCADAHGDDGWILKLIALLRDVWVQRPDIRFSGVCFGHQILCRMLGSTVESTPGSQWELAHTEISLSALGRKLFRMKGEKLFLHQMHQDHVVDAPSAGKSELLRDSAPVEVWGSSETTQVQGVYIKDRLFTSQGHLGFDEDMVRRQIEMRLDSGSIEDEEHAEAAKETAEWKHDGLVVAMAILRLFHGEDANVA